MEPAARLLARLPVRRLRDFARLHAPPQPLVALDVGDRRVGVAFTDEEQIAAFSGGIIERGQKRFTGARATFKAIFEEHPAKGIVVGFPLTMDGYISEQCILTLDFLVWLHKVWPFESVLLWDERLSTVGARGSLGRSKKRQYVDDIVATDFLNQYLDSIRTYSELGRRP